MSIRAGADFTVSLEGVVTTVKPKDSLIVIRKDWDGTSYDGAPEDAGPLQPGLPDPGPALPGPTEFVLAMVRAVRPVWDAAGRAVTEVTATAAHDLKLNALKKDYRILRSTKTAHLWLYHTRYVGSTDPAQMIANGVTQFVERVIDPLGIFGGGPPTQPAEDPRVVAGQSTTDPPPPHGSAHLEAITRGINAGDPVLFEQRTPSRTAGAATGIAGLFEQIARTVGLGNIGPQALPATLAELRAPIVQLVKVIGYSEEIWYANAPQSDQIGRGPPVGPPGKSLLKGLTGGAEGPIPIPHSKITFAPNPYLDVMAAGDPGLKSIVVHYDWQEVGQIVEAPPSSEPTTSVRVARHPKIPAAAVIPVLIEDVTGSGIPGILGATAEAPDEPLQPPLRALVNLLPVSRGETVDVEILGSGDPMLVGQEFVLGRAPLTYLADTGPRSVSGYRSTLRVRVDGIEWCEVPSFYGQPPDARVFVTREDDEDRTHVRFGDGENGARLPAGTDNIVASYRVGSGAAVPPVGTLTSILRPQTGLRAIVNPVPRRGRGRSRSSGADPPLRPTLGLDVRARRFRRRLRDCRGADPRGAPGPGLLELGRPLAALRGQGVRGRRARRGHGRPDGAPGRRRSQSTGARGAGRTDLPRSEPHRRGGTRPRRHRRRRRGRRSFERSPSPAVRS